jgi:hypothetical protein
MSLHIPIAIKRVEPPEQKLPKGRTGAKDRVLAGLAVCNSAGPVLYIVTWIVAGKVFACDLSVKSLHYTP